MFQGWPYSYRAVKSAATAQSSFYRDMLLIECDCLHILLPDCVL